MHRSSASALILTGDRLWLGGVRIIGSLCRNKYPTDWVAQHRQGMPRDPP